MEMLRALLCCVGLLTGCGRTVKASLAPNGDSQQSHHSSYRFEGIIQSMKWVQIREPVEFTAPVSGTFTPNDVTELMLEGMGHSEEFVGLFVGTLKLPPHDIVLEKSAVDRNKENVLDFEETHADQNSESDIDSDKNENNEALSINAKVDLDVEVRSVAGEDELVKYKGTIKDGEVVLNNELLAKLYKAAKHYVGLDGDVHSVKAIQIEGVIQGVITQD